MPRPSSRSQQRLDSTDFELRLGAYALAATAAGVGALALAQPAEAKIVYTKAHVTISANTTTALDLNHDGIADFLLKEVFSSYDASSYTRLWAMPDGKANEIWGHLTSNTAFASALFPGERVGPKGHFLSRAGVMAGTSNDNGVRGPADGSCSGPWAKVKNRYLGLKFVIAGKSHFGWARLNVSCPTHSITITGLLTGYAYETEPNRPIVTGRKNDDSPVASAPRGVSTTASRSGSLGTLSRGSLSLSGGVNEKSPD